MSSPQDQTPKHEDIVAVPTDSPRSTNPFAHSANVTISVPESVEVRLVDASVLADYEVWSLATSILSSAVVGFLVAYLQSAQEYKGVFLVIACVFAALAVLTGFMAHANRRKIRKQARSVRFRVGEPVIDDD